MIISSTSHSSTRVLDQKTLTHNIYYAGSSWDNHWTSSMDRVLIFLDNAANTNKNRYLFSWGMEMIALRKLDYIRFCFMVADHTKFAPDRLFAQVSNSYNRQDVRRVWCTCGHDHWRWMCHPPMAWDTLREILRPTRNQEIPWLPHCSTLWPNSCHESQRELL